MDYNDNINVDKTLNAWKKFSKDNNLIFGTLTLNSENNMIFYQTTFQQSSIKLFTSSEMPQNKNEYLANFNEEGEHRKIGSINIPSTLVKISVHSIDDVKNSGLSSILYIQGDSKKVEKVENFLSNYGKIEKNTNFRPVGSLNIQLIISTLLLLAICILYIFFIFFKTERVTKEVAIMNLLGKTKIEILKKLVWKDILAFFNTLLSTFILIFLVTLFTHIHIYSLSYLIAFIMSIFIFFVSH